MAVINGRWAQGYIKQEMERLKERIAQNIVSTGSNASGDTIRSLFVQVQGEQGGTFVRATLYGRPFFGALETGSRPWKNQYKRVPPFFAAIIQEWIDAKGLDLNAWAVAYKIMREGSSLYRKGGRRNIYSSEIPFTLRRISDLTGDMYVRQTIMITEKLHK